MKVFAEDEFIVASDFHVPGHSRKWVNLLKAYAKENKVKTLAIAGDFFHLESLSDFDIKDKNLDLKSELIAAQKLLKELLGVFKKVYIICGNHDDRLSKKLGRAIGFKDWLETVISSERLVVTDLDYIHIKSGSMRFRVCHSRSYSRVKGSITSALSHNNQENVINGHQHFLSYQTNITDRYVCVDSGCMCDQSLFSYTDRTSRFPKWNNGFVHVRGGKIRVISSFTF